MALHLDYATSIRKELKRYAVWEPGTKKELGDYGILRARTFHKLGNVNEFGIKPEPSKSAPSRYEFSSAGTIISQGNGSVGLTPNVGPAFARASLMIKFAEANALFIRAQSSHWIEVANLRQLATELQKTKRWDWRWKLITGMRIASPLAVIMSASAGAAVSIEGTAKALEEFGLGSLGSETDLSITGDAALKMIGAKGPFLLELVRILPFLGPARAAGSTGNLELDPYVVVSPELFVEDDDE